MNPETACVNDGSARRDNLRRYRRRHGGCEVRAWVVRIGDYRVCCDGDVRAGAGRGRNHPQLVELMRIDYGDGTRERSHGSEVGKRRRRPGERVREAELKCRGNRFCCTEVRELDPQLARVETVDRENLSRHGDRNGLGNYSLVCHEISLGCGGRAESKLPLPGILQRPGAKRMKSPPVTQPPPEARKEPMAKGRGRFVGLLCLGKEKYQPMVIEMLDGVVIRAENLSKPRTDTMNNVTVVGDSLASARMTVTVGIQRHLVDRASELWPKS